MKRVGVGLRWYVYFFWGHLALYFCWNVMVLIKMLKHIKVLYLFWKVTLHNGDSFLILSFVSFRKMDYSISVDHLSRDEVFNQLHLEKSHCDTNQLKKTLMIRLKKCHPTPFKSYISNKVYSGSFLLFYSILLWYLNVRKVKKFQIQQGVWKKK